MAGLEQYRGMTADEKLTVLCVKMDNIERRLDDMPPCPSPRCNEHERRLTTLETSAKAEDDYSASIIAWAGVIIAVVSALIAAYAVTGGG